MSISLSFLWVILFAGEPVVVRHDSPDKDWRVKLEGTSAPWGEKVGKVRCRVYKLDDAEAYKLQWTKEIELAGYPRDVLFDSQNGEFIILIDPQTPGGFGEDTIVVVEKTRGVTRRMRLEDLLSREDAAAIPRVSAYSWNGTHLYYRKWFEGGGVDRAGKYASIVVNCGKRSIDVSFDPRTGKVVGSKIARHTEKTTLKQ
jgi:hypothetical protein